MHFPIATLTLAFTLSGPAPKNGRDLIRAMHDRYAGIWYRTLAFTQRNTATDSLGRETHSTWREYLASPGNLRIDFLPADSGTGIVFRNDSEYVFAHDTLVRSIALVHPLLVLGFDVYVEPVDTTLAKLSRLGIDLSIMHEDVWQGRPVYAVGAPPGDRQHIQFWVDRERLVFLRMLQPARQDPTKVADTRFEDYREVGRAWLSARVVFLVGDKPNWLEEYTDIRTALPLDAGLFDPHRFGSARPRN
ncbi:MAG TPA: hypothetical protein VHQ03_00420 [Candidatus Dormibacteraeota bacterium]|nr:hypothetical protein [Candidatus Dormibacteraeota bacterium]